MALTFVGSLEMPRGRPTTAPSFLGEETRKKSQQGPDTASRFSESQSGFPSSGTRTCLNCLGIYIPTEYEDPYQRLASPVPQSSKNAPGENMLLICVLELRFTRHSEGNANLHSRLLPVYLRQEKPYLFVKLVLRVLDNRIFFHATITVINYYQG